MDVLVESLSGVEAAIATGRAEAARWSTGSPMVVERLRADGRDVAWLDDLLTPGLPEALGFAALDAATCLKPLFERVSVAAGLSATVLHAVMPVQRLLSAMAYKEIVFDAWLAATPGPHLVVGDTRLTPGRAGMGLDFYDTIFAVLAERKGIEVLDLPVGDRAALRREIDRSTAYDRLLSFLDLGPAQLVHRLLLLAGRGRVLGRPGGALMRVLGENEMIREMLPRVLARGGRVVYEPALPPGEPTDDPLPGLPGAAAVAEAMADACAGRGLDVRLAVTPAVAAERLAEASRWWRSAVTAARDRVERWRSMGGVQAVVSNTIGGPGGHFWAAEARRAGIPVIVAEHGASAGLSRYHEPLRPFSEVGPCDVYLACTDNAVRFFDQEPALAGRSLAVGLPSRVRRVPLRSLQRLVTRRRLGARRGQRVVMYLTSAIQNNLRMLPYSPEDRDVHEMERLLAFEVMPHVRGVPVIKFYNTRRGLDADPLASDFRPPAHVRVLRAGDFRFLRAGADALVIQSPMSTLGWALGTGSPLFFVDTPARPLLPHVREAAEQALFVFDAGENGWHERLLESLNRPDQEIRREWLAMAEARESFLDQFVFGPRRAGRNAARTVLDTARRFYSMGRRDNISDGRETR